MSSPHEPSAMHLQSETAPRHWYEGITRYQWLVVLIASAGWVFDAFEGQIYAVQRNQMLAEILHVLPEDSEVRRWGEYFNSAFLVGGALGGIFFGWLGDRWGRRPSMILTILFYSIFSGLTYFAHALWQVGVLRFLVAMGVGGEWAVGAALVAEAVPTHARAHLSGFFHSTSILGTGIAALVGLAVGAHWRLAFLVGIVPSLLVLWVRARVHEPESWHVAKAKALSGSGPALGSFRDLLTSPRWRSRAAFGVLLAAVGMGTFWSVVIAGQDIAKTFLLRHGASLEAATGSAKFAYGFVQAFGGGAGMLAFGPLAVRLGRRLTFVLYHAAALVVVPATCFLPQSYGALLCLLPLYGFFTLGIHAGYAVYFPELFPNHLRSTGTGFCFNGGRLLASSMLIFSGWLKALPGMDIRMAITLMAGLYAFGLVIIFGLPETKGQPLPES